MNRNRVNQLLQAALNATSNGVLITDNNQEDNPIIYVNAGFEQMTGYETDDIIGHNCRFLQGKDTAESDVDRLREAVQAGEAIRIELLNYKKDGTPFWNELSIAPVKNNEGMVTHFIGVQADVTDRKEKEKAQRAQLMAESIVDTVREPIVILNEDLTIHSANKAFYRTFETTPEQTIGQNLYEIEEGFLNIPALKTLLENILPQNNPFENFEISQEFPRLGKRTLVLNARRLEREEERPEYILLAIEDVTRFRQSETSLFESERHSRFIIEGMKDLAVITTDTSGNITTWNVGAQNIFGYEEAEIIGQKSGLLLGYNDTEEETLDHELNSAIQEGQVKKERWMRTK
ncbi:MAG: PAS domain-containing protein, partial [Proteobacteria bacterium]